MKASEQNLLFEGMLRSRAKKVALRFEGQARMPALRRGAEAILFMLALAALLCFAACSEQNEHARLMRDFTGPATAQEEWAGAMRALAMDRADSLLLQTWRTQRSLPPDSFSLWLKKNYWPLQALGLRLAEQATLLSASAQTAAAQSQFGAVKLLAADFLSAVDDRLLLSCSNYTSQLDSHAVRARAQLTVKRFFGRDLLVQGKFKDALDTFDALRAEAERSNDPLLEIQARLGVLDALAQQDRADTVATLGGALAHLAESRGFHWAQAQTLNLVADAHRSLDHDSLALHCAQQALALAERLADHFTVRDCHFYRARVLYRMDRLREAEAALEEVKPRDAAGELRAEVLFVEGQIRLERGEYGLAQTALEQAAESFERGGHFANVAAAYSNLSLLHVETGDYERALADERRAYAWHGRGQSLNRMARSQMNLGFIFAKLDSLAQAQAAYRAALALFRVGKEGRGSAETRLLQGELLLKHGHLPEAEQNFLAAAKEAQTLGFALGHARASLKLAEAALQQKRFVATDSLLHAAETIALGISSPALQAETLWQRAQLAKQQTLLAQALAHLEQGIALQERMFGSLTRDSLRVSFFATVQDFFDEAVSLALALGENERALAFAERGRARALLEAWGEEYADSTQALLGAIPAIAELQKILPARARVLVYRVLPESLALWFIAPNKLLTRQVPLTRAALEDSAQKYLRSLGASDLPSFRRRVTQNRVAVYEENRAWGEKFYELLLAPMASQLAPEHELYVIPDGILHQLPFGAFVSPRALFVEEENAVLKTPSLAVLYRGLRRPLPAPRFTDNRLLYVGNPGGDLPAAWFELNHVTQHFTRKKILTQHLARFDTIKTSLREGAEVVHLSLHAVADPKRGFNSYLELSRSEATNLRPSTERIYARRLLEWEMASAWLVLLNGCETATGQVVRGEGVVNLARLFALQRVSTVIASLWKNDDRWSAELVAAFYRELAGGAAPETALHRAKLEIISKLARDPNVKHPLPYFWSVLELYLNRAVQR